MLVETFAGRLQAKVAHVDALAQFFAAPAGVSDPEAKRKVIGREFVDVIRREAVKLSGARWLAQSKICPDMGSGPRRGPSCPSRLGMFRKISRRPEGRAPASRRKVPFIGILFTSAGPNRPEIRHAANGDQRMGTEPGILLSMGVTQASGAGCRWPTARRRCSD